MPKPSNARIARTGRTPAHEVGLTFEVSAAGCGCADTVGVGAGALEVDGLALGAGEDDGAVDVAGGTTTGAGGVKLLTGGVV